jgi:hypothetical protein
VDHAPRQHRATDERHRRQDRQDGGFGGVTAR